MPFLDHMMTALARYGGLDLAIVARGDLRHHIVEDVALTVGQAVRRSSLPAGRGALRRAHGADGRRARAGRPRPGRTAVLPGSDPSTFYEHWMRSFCDAGKFTLHLRVLRGDDRHHVVEAAFKALGFRARAGARGHRPRGQHEGGVALRSARRRKS